MQWLWEELAWIESIVTAPTPKTAAEYKAALDALLAQIERMDERSQQTWAEIERLKAESAAREAENALLKASIDRHQRALTAELSRTSPPSSMTRDPVEERTMDESLSSPKTAAECRDVLDDLLRQIDRMNEQMAQNRVDIDRMRSESLVLRADTDRVLAQIDTRLAAIRDLL